MKIQKNKNILNLKFNCIHNDYFHQIKKIKYQIYMHIKKEILLLFVHLYNLF